MKSASAPALLRVALLSLAIPLAARAQTESPPKASQPPADEKAAFVSSDPTPLISFKFPGGTMAQFSTFLDGVTDGKGYLNLLVEPSAASLAVPPFELRRASADSLVTALHELIRSQGSVTPLSKTTSPGESFLAIVSAHKPDSSAIKPDNITQPVLVAHLLKPKGAYEIADVVSAIQTAWRLDPANAPDGLVLKYHEPTRLLLASGPRHGVTQLVPGIISQLTSTQTFLVEPKK